jgi:hypothetical protein
MIGRITGLSWGLSKVCAIVCVLCIAGCVSSDMMAIGGKTYPPRPSDYVIEVFSSEEAPVQVMREIANLRPLKELPPTAVAIGRVDSNGAPLASWGSLIGDAMGKARSLGGDALVVHAWGQTVSSVDAYGNAQYAKHLSMKVMRYRP